MRVIRGRFGYVCVNRWPWSYWDPFDGYRRDVEYGSKVGRVMALAWRRAHRATLRALDDGAHKHRVVIAVGDH